MSNQHEKRNESRRAFWLSPKPIKKLIFMENVVITKRQRCYNINRNEYSLHSIESDVISPKPHLSDGVLTKEIEALQVVNSQEIWKAFHHQLFEEIKRKVQKTKNIKRMQLKAFAKLSKRIDFRSMSPKSKRIIVNCDKSIRKGQFVNSKYFINRSTVNERKLGSNHLPILSSIKLQNLKWSQKIEEENQNPLEIWLASC